jgi:hypothetical protein
MILRTRCPDEGGFDLVPRRPAQCLPAAFVPIVERKALQDATEVPGRRAFREAYIEPGNHLQDHDRKSEAGDLDVILSVPGIATGCAPSARSKPTVLSTRRRARVSRLSPRR